MPDEEHISVIKFTVERLRRVPVIAGTGAMIPDMPLSLVKRLKMLEPMAYLV